MSDRKITRTEAAIKAYLKYLGDTSEKISDEIGNIDWGRVFEILETKDFNEENGSNLWMPVDQDNDRSYWIMVFILFASSPGKYFLGEPDKELIKQVDVDKFESFKCFAQSKLPTIYFQRPFIAWRKYMMRESDRTTAEYFGITRHSVIAT